MPAPSGAFGGVLYIVRTRGDMFSAKDSSMRESLQGAVLKGWVNCQSRGTKENRPLGSVERASL